MGAPAVAAATTGSGPLGERDAVRRLLQRVGLGPRPGELDPAAAAGFDATLTALLPPSVRPDAGAALTPPPAFPSPPANADQKTARKAQRQAAAQEGRRLVTWWLDRLAAVDQPYTERMTWFWHGHFATSIKKVGSAPLMLGQNETQRRLGTGDFRALARAMIVDPALLVWLDGSGSKAAHPNENLAREFMELFTLGVGNYAEDDVRQAARALTGWAVRFTDDQAVQVPRNHDAGPETVLRTSQAYDAASLVDLLVTQPASPTFLARRLWVRMVGETLPDAQTTDALVQAYGPGHDVTALVRAIATSAAFRDPRSVLVRQPVEWLVAALRALRIPASRLPATVLAATLAATGQTPFAPPNVGGWPSGTRWLTTTAALARLQAGRALAATGDISPVADEQPAQRVAAVADLLGLAPFGTRTAAALTPLAGNPPQLVAAALASSESCVSA